MTTHGRYLVAPAASAGAGAGFVVGCHGYAEAAEVQMTRIRRIAGADAWTVISIQGMHRFYQRRSSDVVASWMTRQDRDQAIADNIAYVGAVVGAVAQELGDPARVVFAGFSQGVATAYRAAAAIGRAVHGVMSVGGDVPPEITDAGLARVGGALVCRGATDSWYSVDKFDHDIGRLRRAGVPVTPLAFDGGHEWSDAVSAAAAHFLRERA